MIERIITTELIGTYEPSLVKLLTSERLNNVIAEAQNSLIHSLKNEGKKVRLYCVPLLLNTAFKEDSIERTVFVIKGKNLSATNIKLIGSDDEISSKILYENTITQTNVYIPVFLLETKKFYKVQISGTYTEIETYLIDANYYKAMLYKTLEIIMRGLSVNLNDTWFEKSNKYEELYNSEYQEMLLSYMNEDTGEIEMNKSNIGSIELLR